MYWKAKQKEMDDCWKKGCFENFNGRIRGKGLY
jgi:hypothetical protein